MIKMYAIFGSRHTTSNVRDAIFGSRHTTSYVLDAIFGSRHTTSYVANVSHRCHQCLSFGIVQGCLISYDNSVCMHH